MEPNKIAAKRNKRCCAIGKDRSEGDCAEKHVYLLHLF